MEPSLQHEIFIEGAALHREIREWREGWTRDLKGCEGPTAAEDGQPPPSCAGGRPSPLHTYYPFLFRTCFPEIPIETVRELARADRLYTEHLLEYDRILDRQKPTETIGLLVAQLEHMQSLKRIYTFFPPNHPFWSYFYECYFQTWRSVREERLCHSHRIGPFPLTRFCTLAKGKTALLKPSSVALAYHANRVEETHPLSASLDRHHIALVLVDDLEDWRQDLKSRNFTYLLTRLIRGEGLANQILSGHPVSSEHIGRLLYSTGLMERQLRMAEFFFGKSNETVRSLPLPLWRHFNNGFRHRCRALRHDLAEIRRREEGRVRRRVSMKQAYPTEKGLSRSDVAAAGIRSGIGFLADAHALQGTFQLYRSPHAYMCPSRAIAPSRSVTTLIVRSLEPVQAMASALTPLIRSASEWLRHTHGTGLPSGLPAGLESAFRTIPSDRNELSRFDASFAPGFGPLTDGLFWSNFLYTCSRVGFHPHRLHAYVRNCFLREDYNAWGFGVSFGPVSSPWTRHACRPLLPLLLVCRAGGDHLPREAVQKSLLQGYRANGSWGNTTETALTLLCLLLIAYEGPELVPAIDKLHASQEPDGSWAPNAIYCEGKGYYGSRELTTAWCLEALYRYHNRDVSAA